MTMAGSAGGDAAAAARSAEAQELTSYLVGKDPRPITHPPPLIVDMLTRENLQAWYREHRPDVILTGGDAESPIDKVIREGVVVGLARLKKGG